MDTQISGLAKVGSCAACPAFELNICRGLAQAAKEGSSSALIKSFQHTIAARRRIFRERDLMEVVPIICRGWAVSAVTLSDGRRQILSFLLPGDIASTALIFEPISQCSVEAITEVHYHTFKRAELKDTLLKHPDLSDKLFNIWIDEKARADQLAVDLGQRAADERVANLILNLFDRLTGRGMARDQTMDCPLRQHHIADATGLTAIHVNRVMSAFRRAGLLETNERSLTILDLTGLRRIANTR
jgi:CRP/FNR family transcriptional regulator